MNTTMRYQIGRAERPEVDDPRFDTLDAAKAAAHDAAIGDYVYAVWEWQGQDEHTAFVRCLVYGGEEYRT